MSAVYLVEKTVLGEMYVEHVMSTTGSLSYEVSTYVAHATLGEARGTCVLIQSQYARQVIERVLDYHERLSSGERPLSFDIPQEWRCPE